MNFRRRRGLGGRGSGRHAPPEPESGASGAAGGPGARGRGVGGGGSRPPRRWLLTVLVVLACFGIGYLIAARWLFPAPETGPDEQLTAVPELVGLSTDEARSRLQKAGLALQVQSEIYHPKAPEGAVLGQRPLPGQMARPGAPVTVTVSKGPEQQSVPELDGLSERQARLVLERLGFRVTLQATESSRPKGEVVGTDPDAGTTLAVPADVALQVSKGPQVVTVPDLTGRHVSDVRDLLSKLGLEMGSVTFDPSAPEAPGRVIGQWPPSGYELRTGGRVSVRVAGTEPGPGSAQPAPGSPPTDSSSGR